MAVATRARTEAWHSVCLFGGVTLFDQIAFGASALLLLVLLGLLVWGLQLAVPFVLRLAGH